MLGLFARRFMLKGIMSKSGQGETNRARTNATARLSAVLNKLERIAVEKPVADVLASVFEINDPDPNRSFLLAYRAITTLLENAEEEVKTYLASEVGFYSADFPPLRACFTPKNSAHPWNTYKNHLSPKQVTAISHTAQRLKSIISEYEPTADDLSEIRTAIQEMRELIENEHLSPLTREALLESLNEIETAINQYCIWGSKGVDRAFKFYTGTLVADGAVRSELQRVKKEDVSLWDKAMRFGAGLSLFLSIVHGVHQFKQDYLLTLERLMLPHSTDDPAVIIEAPPTEPKSPQDGHHQRGSVQVKI